MVVAFFVKRKFLLFKSKIPHFSGFILKEAGRKAGGGQQPFFFEKPKYTTAV